MLFKFVQTRLIILLILVQALYLVSFGQPKDNEDFVNANEKVEISEKDIAEIIECFQTDSPIKFAENFKTKMPASVTDKKNREKILQNLPAVVKKLQINNAQIVESFRRVVVPILEFYNRVQIYEIIVINHKTPVMFSDSGVVLVVSTGLIERVRSDDQLLGFVAHELAHEYFAKASINTRFVIRLTENDIEYKALTRKYWESLALIELQCDSFSALNLAALGKNPLAFIEEIERIEQEYPQFVGKFHPSPEIRRKVVEGVLSGAKFTSENRISEELQKLKKLLREK